MCAEIISRRSRCHLESFCSSTMSLASRSSISCRVERGKAVVYPQPSACFSTSTKQGRSQRLSCFRRRRAPGAIGTPELGERSSLVKTRCGLVGLVFGVAESVIAFAESFFAASWAGGCCPDGASDDCGPRARRRCGTQRTTNRKKEAGRRPKNSRAKRGFETEIMAERTPCKRGQ